MMFADGAVPRPGRLWVLAHYIHKAFPILLVVWAALPALGIPDLINYPAFTAALALMLRHGARLCELCMDELPVLDPSGAVERHRRLLRLFHAATASTKRLAGVTAGMLVAYVALAPVLFSLPTLVRVALVLALFGGPLIAFYRALWHHNRLQPWCPWCRHGGRGPRPSPEPAPTPDLSLR